VGEDERIDWHRIVTDMYGGRHTPEEHIEDLRHKMSQLDKERQFFKEQVAKLDLALEAAKAAPPAPALVALLGPIPTCPTCGAGEAWRSRNCCPLGTLVGQVEGGLVADALMQKDA
jgi:hypothetical protein